MQTLLLATALLVGCSGSNAPADRSDGGEQQPAGPPVWETRAPALTERTEVVAVRARGLVHVIGGFDSTGTVATVEIYDPAANEWAPGPPLPIAVNHAAATSLSGDVYVFGGWRGPGIDRATRRAFVLRDGSWKSLPRMPSARAAAGAAAVGNRIYVVGGRTRAGLARRTLVYDVGTGRWLKAPGLRKPRHHLAVASNGRRIFAAGGRTSGFASNLDDFESYRPSARRWRVLDPLPTARGGLSGAFGKGVIFALGGEARGGTFDEVEGYVIRRARWKKYPPLPTPRHGLGAAAAAGMLFALSGGPQPGLHFSDATEALPLP